MQRSPDERVTRQLARDIARREQLKALVAGSIGKLGSHYVLALEAVNAESGDVMAREQVEAAGTEQVLTALGGATSRLREKLGESLTSIQRFDAPLPNATTPSLEALHAYSLALNDGRIARAAGCHSAPAARHRDRPGFRDGARAARCRLSQHRTIDGGRADLATSVRAARSRQRARALFHFVALLHGHGTGLGQSARAEHVVDEDVPARSVCVQQPGARGGRVRAARPRGGSVPRSDAPRSALHSAVRQHRRVADGA